MTVLLFWLAVGAVYFVLGMFIGHALRRAGRHYPTPGDDAWRDFWERGQP